MPPSKARLTAHATRLRQVRLHDQAEVWLLLCSTSNGVP
jgi:hypothetical protein